MTLLEENYELILKYERTFALRVASEVIEKPPLTIWMILIPIIIVFFFYRFQKYVEGKNVFVEKYMIGRRKALDEAFVCLEEDRPTDLRVLAAEARLPEDVLVPYARWLEVMVDRYRKLLRSPGRSYDELVRSVDKNRTHYLLFLDRFDKAEQDLNGALKPHLLETTPDAGDVIEKIERVSRLLRRDHAEAAFP